MDELGGCLLGLVGIVVAVMLIFYVVLGVLIAIGTVLSYTGMVIVFGLDFLARAWSVVGVENPVIGWGLLGLTVGALVGLVLGLRKAGQRRLSWKLHVGVAATGLVLLVGAYYAAAMTFPSRPPRLVSKEYARPVAPLAGARDGESSGKPARLTPRVLSDEPLTLKGLGPIRIGMTTSEVSLAIGQPLIGGDNEGCAILKPRDAPSGLTLMATSGRIARIDIGERAYLSKAGARVGDSEEHVMSLYRGRLQVENHQYVEGGHYLVFVPEDQSDTGYRMVFETDGGRVTSFRAGKIPEVQYVEGCS